ncbi:MAG: hypothetical protein EU549_01305 [Promethearchaeota archaeon]|nr:MAG: hypothetical protein EU549_01305 [Candidatus Lokiarchaeota archaeon]
MEELVIYSTIILTFIRFIGLAVSIDFYFKMKNRTHIFFTLGWGVFLLAGFAVLIDELFDILLIIDILKILNGIFIAIGGLLIVCGIYSYFRVLNLKIIHVLNLLVIAVSLIIYIPFGTYLVRYSSMIICLFLFISLFILMWLEREKFKKIIGKPIKWYYIVVFFFFCYINIYLLIYHLIVIFLSYKNIDSFAIFLYYFNSIAITILVIFFSIQLEYAILNNHKFQLKDKYSHNLGNIMQSIISSQEMIEEHNSLGVDTTALEGLNAIKLKEASNLIKEIRDL